MTSRRTLIVADWLLATLLGLVGVANFALGDSVNVVAGISALVLSASAAVTASLFIASGGWRKDEVRKPDSDGRVPVRRPQRTGER
jgi:hypothetical protein